MYSGRVRFLSMTEPPVSDPQDGAKLEPIQIHGPLPHSVEKVHELSQLYASPGPVISASTRPHSGLDNKHRSAQFTDLARGRRKLTG